MVKAFNVLVGFYACVVVAVSMIAIMYGSAPKSHASNGDAVDGLRRAIITLESRVKQLESRPACPCARSVISTPAPRKPITVWIPPRQTRDEDDYTPGRYEVLLEKTGGEE